MEEILTSTQVFAKIFGDIQKERNAKTMLEYILDVTGLKHLTKKEINEVITLVNEDLQGFKFGLVK